MKKLRVAIIGQGRSGRNIHGDYFKSEYNKNYEVVAVVEKDAFRRQRAEEEYPGCKSFESYTDLYGRDDLDLIVNASYSEDHYPITKDLLLQGFNVLCEKPMGRNQYECDNLIRIANEKNVMLAVFQQSLFAPYFIHAYNMSKSGKIGEIKQIDISFNAFARRWDWQTLQCKIAGGLYNTGPHPVGYALGFLDYDKNAKVAFSRLDRTLTSGDGDDFCKIIITAPDKPFVDVEIHSNDAYCPCAIKLYGTKGTYTATATEFKVKYIVDGENPERPVIFESLKDENGYPIYCGEQLITHEESDTVSGEIFTIGNVKFYEMVYERLVNNKPLVIKPEYAAQIINIIETVHGQNPLSVKY